MEEKKLINIAIKKLAEGQLVIFPTETVYGIGADATNTKAVKKIYSIKKRPTKNPIISHFKDLKAVMEHAILDDYAKKLADFFWPGPLTLILKKKKNSNISALVSNNNIFIGCRVPSNLIAQKILHNFPNPIAAPSANITSRLSTTNLNQIDKKLKKNTYMINGGNCNLGLESTVISLVEKKPKILRYGSITYEEVKKIIPNIEIDFSKKNNKISPGRDILHYSPNLPIRINITKVLKGEVLLNFGSNNNLSSDILELNLSEKGNLKEAAKNLYSYLHKLDKKKYKGIAVAPIPDFDLGKTINDRLTRACAKNN